MGHKTTRKIRVAIVGVGNCASALIQGVQFYRHAPADRPVPGLMHVNLGGYHVKDIEFSAAFDIGAAKVGEDLAKAVFAAPNNTIRFSKLPRTGVIVQRGPTLDGVGEYLDPVIRQSKSKPVDVTRILKQSRTD